MKNLAVLLLTAFIAMACDKSGFSSKQASTKLGIPEGADDSTSGKPDGRDDSNGKNGNGEGNGSRGKNGKGEGNGNRGGEGEGDGSRGGGSEDGCETAFAYGQKTFWDLGIGTRWGWQLSISSGTSGSSDIWAGAGQNDTSKGTLVGQLNYEFDGSNLKVDMVLKPGFTMKVTQLYAGASDINTTAPGQFGNQHALNDATSDSYAITFDPSLQEVKIVAHADVCGPE